MTTSLGVHKRLPMRVKSTTFTQKKKTKKKTQTQKNCKTGRNAESRDCTIGAHTETYTHIQTPGESNWALGVRKTI